MVRAALDDPLDVVTSGMPSATQFALTVLCYALILCIFGLLVIERLKKKTTTKVLVLNQICLVRGQPDLCHLGKGTNM